MPAQITSTVAEMQLCTLLTESKKTIMANFDFRCCAQMMLATKFGWVSNLPEETRTVEVIADRARAMLDDMLGHCIVTALRAIREETENDWPCWQHFSAFGGFFVYVFSCGTLRAHFSPEDWDNWDYAGLNELRDKYLDSLADQRSRGPVYANAGPKQINPAPKRRLLQLEPA